MGAPGRDWYLRLHFSPLGFGSDDRLRGNGIMNGLLICERLSCLSHRVSCSSPLRSTGEFSVLTNTLSSESLPVCGTVTCPFIFSLPFLGNFGVKKQKRKLLFVSQFLDSAGSLYLWPCQLVTGGRAKRESL